MNNTLKQWYQSTLPGIFQNKEENHPCSHLTAIWTAFNYQTYAKNKSENKYLPVLDRSSLALEIQCKFIKLQYRVGL